MDHPLLPVALKTALQLLAAQAILTRLPMDKANAEFLRLVQEHYDGEDNDTAYRAFIVEASVVFQNWLNIHYGDFRTNYPLQAGQEVIGELIDMGWSIPAVLAMTARMNVSFNAARPGSLDHGKPYFTLDDLTDIGQQIGHRVMQAGDVEQHGRLRVTAVGQSEAVYVHHGREPVGTGEQHPVEALFEKVTRGIGMIVLPTTWIQASVFKQLHMTLTALETISLDTIEQELEKVQFLHQIGAQQREQVINAVVTAAEVLTTKVVAGSELTFLGERLLSEFWGDQPFGWTKISTFLDATIGHIEELKKLLKTTGENDVAEGLLSVVSVLGYVPPESYQALLEVSNIPLEVAVPIILYLHSKYGLARELYEQGELKLADILDDHDHPGLMFTDIPKSVQVKWLEMWMNDTNPYNPWELKP